MSSLQTSLTLRRALIFAVPLILVLVIFTFNISLEGAQQFSFLAQSFLHGHLYFMRSIGGQGFDPVYYHGKVFWDEGPLPAIVLMPFVAVLDIFHQTFLQGYIDWIFLAGIVYLLYRLARHFKYSKEDSLTLLLGFFLGSVFIGVASVSSSWLFAQVITTFLLLWSLYEYFNKRRWWLLGVLCGLIALTRITAAAITLFYVLELWQLRKDGFKISPWLKLLLPVALCLMLICLYNYLRFNNPLNGGYNFQLLSPAAVQSRALGIYGLVHIPAGIYSAFLRGPVPVLRSATSWTLKFPYLKDNNLGMSMFITSPYLLNLFTYKWSSFDSRCRHLLLAAGLCALGVFSSFALGPQQFGYRYSLDFLPELFVVFMIMYKKHHLKLSRGIKILLLGSGITNFYLLQSYLY